MGVDSGRAHKIAGTASNAALGSGTVTGSAEMLPLPLGVGAAAAGHTAATAVPLNAAATSTVAGPTAAVTAPAAAPQLSDSATHATARDQHLHGVDVVFVIGDAGPRLPPVLQAAVAGLRCPCYSLQLPANSRLSQVRSAQALAAQLCVAARAAVAPLLGGTDHTAAAQPSATCPIPTSSSRRGAPLRRTSAGETTISSGHSHSASTASSTRVTLSAAIVGVGFAAAVSYEVALQLQESADAVTRHESGGGGHATGRACSSGLRVKVLVLLEDPRMRRCCEVVSQPWFQLRDWVAEWRPDLDLAEYAMVGRLLEEQVGGEEQGGAVVGTGSGWRDKGR